MTGAGAGPVTGAGAGPVTGAGFGDERVERPVLAERTVFEGRIFDVAAREVDLGAAGVVTREFVRHPGAVAVVVVRDRVANDEIADDARGLEVLLLRQYRVPVGAYLWEIPAGLLDGGPGETLLGAAQRELAEEADLVAGRWDVLADFATTPGGNSEAIRIFLARDVSPAPDSGFVREGEEAEIELAWVPLGEAAQAVLSGRMHSPSACLGVLAATVSERMGFADLRAVTAPFALRPDVPPA